MRLSSRNARSWFMLLPQNLSRPPLAPSGLRTQ
uniref:Uncharacterized protein n=1 Tax=Arundo donax TaxID=35708 RepID=A0A0A9H8Z6_ARUDO